MNVNRRYLVFSAIVFAAAFAQRFQGGLDDLWLDEIWTLSPLVLGRVQSVWDIFFTLKDENNHFLNTLWMYCLGRDADRMWYRLPPMILGSLTVLLARLAVAKSGPVAVRVVTVLMVPSYLLIHYASEARGYAYQMFFALAAYVILERMLDDFRAKLPTKTRLSPVLPLAFGACCLLGCLGQPAFLIMFAALGGWAGVAVFRQSKSFSKKIRWLLGVFLCPTLILFAFWLISLSQLKNSGGPRENPWMVAVSTLSLMAGGPQFGDLALLFGALVAIAVLVQLVWMLRTGDDRAVCWGLMIALPLGYVIVMNRQEVYPRYFLGTVILLNLALAELAARCSRVGRSGWIAVYGILIATVVGNVIHLTRFFRDGRGHGQAVVEFLRDQTDNGPIVVGSDQAFRHALLLDYFGRRLELLPRIAYVGEGPWPPQGPQWVLRHSLDETADFEPAFTAIGHRYELRRVFPYAGLSGWHTGVYEQVKK